MTPVAPPDLLIKYEVASLDATSKERVLKKMNAIETLRETFTANMQKSLMDDADVNQPGKKFDRVFIESIATPVVETTTVMAEAGEEAGEEAGGRTGGHGGGVVTKKVVREQMKVITKEVEKELDDTTKAAVEEIMKGPGREIFRLL